MNKRIFCFWFGSPMNDNRVRSINAIRTLSNVPVELIAEQDIAKWTVPGHPIHNGFQYLSATHKSDYMRSYMMYHYGGGYTDIKSCNGDWNQYFDKLENSHYQFIGYAERAPFDIGYAPAAQHFAQLAGMCQYIFKPKTEIAEQWYTATQQKMDTVYELLKQHPGHYHPRAIKGGAQGTVEFIGSQYPLAWTELLGAIFHKVQSENLGKYSLEFPYPLVGNHR